MPGLLRLEGWPMLRRVLLLLLLCGPAAAQEDVLAMLREPGTVAIMRHARAPGGGDPPGLRIGECATQRNLDEAGRDQARRIGARLRAAGVAAPVYTSEWCRTRETAELLGVGPVQALPALNSFFGDRGSEPAQTAALRAFLDGLQATAVLVTHQVNITALTQVFPADGELLVLRRGPGGYAVAGRFRLPPQ